MLAILARTQKKDRGEPSPQASSDHVTGAQPEQVSMQAPQWPTKIHSIWQTHRVAPPLPAHAGQNPTTSRSSSCTFISLLRLTLRDLGPRDLAPRR